MLKVIQAIYFSISLSLLCLNVANATNENKIDLTAPNPNSNAAIDRRAKKENIVEKSPFSITFFKQNYILLYYYTASPDNNVYVTHIPPGEHIKSSEVKYQLSLKAPIWKNILGSNSSMYFGYTQLSYWQFYNKNAFFRETDFQPEIFVTNQLYIPLVSDWQISAINVGAVHASNGFGDKLERSWNRVYIEAVASGENFMLSVKPWYVVRDSTYQKLNPNMASYLGYGEITAAYKFSKQVITLQTHSLIEGGGRHATFIVSYSFPITSYLNGFVQIFSGYGQSLIEYNHRTNSAGVGISLNNLI